MADFSGLNGLMNTTMSVLARHAGIFFGITGLVHIPMLLYVGWLVLAIEDASLTESSAQNALIGLGILTFLLQMVATAAVVYGVFQTLRDKPITFGDTLRIGMSRVLPVIGVSLATGILVGFGMLLLIIPGVILLMMLYAAVPAAVVENLGVGPAMERSRMLTAGYRWPILGLVFLLGLITGVPDAVFEHLLGQDASTVGSYLLISAGLSIIGSTLNSVAASVTYHELRRVKDGLDLDEIAAVFD